MGKTQVFIPKEFTVYSEKDDMVPSNHDKPHGSGRSAGEGKGYPLQCSWPSLVAQLGKNPPAVQETPVRSPGWEDPLEKGKAAHSSILAWRIPWTV